MLLEKKKVNTNVWINKRKDSNPILEDGWKQTYVVHVVMDAGGPGKPQAPVGIAGNSDPCCRIPRRRGKWCLWTLGEGRARVRGLGKNDTHLEGCRGNVAVPFHFLSRVCGTHGRPGVSALGLSKMLLSKILLWKG